MFDSPPCADLPELALATFQERLRFANIEHPAMQALVPLACARAEQCMAVRPGDFPDPGEATPETPKPFPPVDPVRILQQEVALPSLPQVVVELQEHINSESSSAEDMGEVISRDVGLAAALLRMVNSAFFAFPSQIETISRAVTVVGTKQLTTLALGASVMGMFKKTDILDMDMERFWRHSIACGIIARAIAQRLKLEEPERYFVAGLLHDLGRPAMFAAHPDRAQAALALAHSGLLTPSEQTAFGFDHARFGSMLLRKWNFPFFIVMGVLHHHNPEKALEHPQAAIIHVADVMAQTLGHGATAHFHIPPLDNAVYDSLPLTTDMLTTITEELDEILDAFCSLLVPGKG